jgi:hypothetical protein
VEQVQEALGVPITFVSQDGFKLLDAILETTDDGMPEEEDNGFFPEDDEYFRYNPDADFEQRK